MYLRDVQLCCRKALAAKHVDIINSCLFLYALNIDPFARLGDLHIKLIYARGVVK